MAIMCLKDKKNDCKGCSNYKFDEDFQRMCCKPKFHLDETVYSNGYKLKIKNCIVSEVTAYSCIMEDGSEVTLNEKAINKEVN